MPMPKDWNEVKAARDFIQLPPDGYICKILAAKEAEYQGKDGGTFSRLEIAFDISDGEYTGYFKNEFDMQQQEDKKWKGVLRLYYGIRGDGSQQDGWTKSAIKGIYEALTDSNPGIGVSIGDDWKFSGLDGFKGKSLGVLFRNEEWQWDGRTGWKAQPFRAISAASIRDGKFKIPKEKPLANKVVLDEIAASDDFAVIDETEDLPF